MCCFSREIESVTNTRIFARSTLEGRQFIVYAMAIESSKEVAMVLPLPVEPGHGEDAMKFIDLSHYPKFFQDMASGFPLPRSKSGGADPFGAAAPAEKLAVHSVGAFDASYVPSVKDFTRLDGRFTLPAATWDRLPGYKGFGFAVFKLKPGKQEVHPMAFSFPSAAPDRLFFPTLHIHDGEVHEKAEFDHTLYCQGAGLRPGEWQESERIANQFMEATNTKGIVMAAQHIFKRRLRGNLANTDWLVKASAVV